MCRTLRAAYFAEAALMSRFRLRFRGDGATSTRRDIAEGTH